MLACPKCSSKTLAPVTRDGLIGVARPPRRCSNCHGIWLEQDVVDKLRETGLLEAIDDADTSRRDEDRRTGLCPAGHGILTRAKVAWQAPYYLERCSRCGGLWFDAGEWNRIVAEHVLEHLHELWLPTWRQRLSENQSKEQLVADLRAKLGPELLGKLEELAKELEGRADAAVALAYLRERVVASQRGSNH